MRRTSMHCRTSKTGPTAAVVDLVLERDGHACVRCGKPATGARGRDWSVQHRIPRGMGGTRRADLNEPQNLLILCGSGTTGCHGDVERYRADSYVHGWLCHRSDDPAAVVVLVAGGRRWVYLTAAGEYVDQPPEVTP